MWLTPGSTSDLKTNYAPMLFINTPRESNEEEGQT